AGYNTVADVLRTDTAAVLVPYAIGGETEQTDRAHALERLGRAAVVTEEDLNSATMAAAIARALAAPSPHLEINLDGARTSAEIVARLLARHRNDAPLSSA
ncbi:MAG: glycosyltransferase, partial [Pseudomonadota bacterium]